MSACRCVRFFALGLLFVSLGPQIAARKHSKKKPPHKEQQSSAQIEAAARLQIFLDRSNFSPGKIDGRYNEFTWKVLALYRQSRGEQPQPPPPNAKSNVAPDLNGLDLGNVEPVFITYTVTQADLQNVGKLPASPKEQAKLKALLYSIPGKRSRSSLAISYAFRMSSHSNWEKSKTSSRVARLTRQLLMNFRMNRIRHHQTSRRPLRIHRPRPHHHPRRRR